MRRFIAFWPLLSMASAGCLPQHTCCCRWDFLIPVDCQCVEDEPCSPRLQAAKDNCGRAGRSPVPWWVHLESKDWALHGVCTETMPVVTRAELEAKEQREREWEGNFTYFCVQKKANCSATEECYYDRRRRSSTGDIWSSSIADGGAVCLCSYPLARTARDGTGACAECKAVHDGRPAYVQRPGGDPTGPGTQSFHNGELACALGPRKEVQAVAERPKAAILRV
mmetsp:Transcript_71060/g.229962  ORF Transcript_71060/g.229962 Transcript_71060/m.229962 type:complete len:224 (+) Transcript_71060:63-734(+)